MKYDAFISYRHTPLDMEIAKKLHRGLETFTIPASVRKKTGKKKIRRVFRDQEELPIGSDLTNKISSALQESEFLIVVCSPNTPASEWVCKEIDTFIQLHDRSHILAILIDGEPDESFPAAILKDEQGRSVEPLAADIRGASRRERNRKFKTELLRLAAPVIGCSFDDLRQRHRERLVRKAIAYVSVTALLTGGAGAAFGFYNASIAKQMETLAQEKGALAGDNAALALEISNEFRDKQINQSRFYAAEAMSLLSEGKRRQATLVASMGLPGEKTYRPYVSEAEYALSSALHAYDDGEVRSFYQNLEHDLPVSKMWTNDNGSRVITLDFSNYVHVWNTDTWEEVVCIAPEILEDNYLDDVQTAGADEQFVYILTEEHFCAYDFSGQMKYHIDKPDVADYYGGIISSDEGVAFITDGFILQVVQLSDGLILAQYDNDVPGMFNNKQKYAGSLDLFVNGHMSTEDSPAILSVLRYKDGYYNNFELTDTSLLQFCITDEGNIAVLSNSGIIKESGPAQITLELFTPEGERLWSRSFTAEIYNPSEYRVLIKSHTYPVENGNRCGIVCAIEDEAFTFDEADGSELMHINLPASVVALLLSGDSRGGFFGYLNGDIQLADMDNGRLVTNNANQHVNGLRDIMAVNNAMVTRTAYDTNVNVIAYQTAPDLENLPEVKPNLYPEGISPNGDYYVMEKGGSQLGYVFFDPDGNELYDLDLDSSYALGSTFCGNLFVAADRDGLHFIDPLAKTLEEYSFSELGIDSAMINKVRFSQNGDFGTFWYYKELYAVDLKKKCCILQTTTDDSIGAAIITENGASVFVSEKGKNLYVLDVAGGKTLEFDDKRLQEASDYYGMEYLTVSRDGRYAAMCCMDQKVWIVDTQSGALSGGLPMQMASSTFLLFSDDGQYLMIQGNDYIFRIWDINAEEYINSFQTGNIIRYAVPDEADGKLALISGYDLYFLDTRDYGVCAYVPDCIAYIKNTNSFIQFSEGSVYRCHYKNYHTLVEEAQRQFPGATLSNAEMVEYNIN